MEKVRVGVIGVGMGRHHAVRYRECEQAELVALCDANPERLAAVADELGVERRFTSVEEMLQLPGLQAVSVALPNFLHAPVSLQALEAGCHVMCEKPLAMNAGEARQMVETARRVGGKLMVHFNVRFNPTSQLVKREVDSGRLGDIYYARSVWHRNRGIPGLGGWFTDKARSGGGALIDIGVHRLDLALWLMGYPRPVSVTGVTYSDLGRDLAARQEKTFDVDDLAAGFIRFENGASLTLETSWASNTGKREDQWTQLLGRKAGALIRNTDEGYHFEAQLFEERDGRMETLPLEGPLPYAESAQQHFARCILEDRETMAPGEQGLIVMQILDAIYESAATGREVIIGGGTP